MRIALVGRCCDGDRRAVGDLAAVGKRGVPGLHAERAARSGRYRDLALRRRERGLAVRCPHRDIRIVVGAEGRLRCGIVGKGCARSKDARRRHRHAESRRAGKREVRPVGDREGLPGGQKDVARRARPAVFLLIARDGGAVRDRDRAERKDPAAVAGAGVAADAAAVQDEAAAVGHIDAAAVAVTEAAGDASAVPAVGQGQLALDQDHEAVRLRGFQRAVDREAGEVQRDAVPRGHDQRSIAGIGLDGLDQFDLFHVWIRQILLQAEPGGDEAQRIPVGEGLLRVGGGSGNIVIVAVREGRAVGDREAAVEV